MLSEHGKEDLTLEQDVKIMSDFIKAGTIENRSVDTFYFSSNPAVTEILLGKEGMSHPLIESNHLAIGKNQYGEAVLVDRWATPYRIHLIHRNKIEVFSAGSDRIMGNEDDLRWPPLEVK